MRLDEVKTLDELREFCVKGPWWTVSDSQYDSPRETATLPTDVVIDYLKGGTMPWLVNNEDEAWILYYRACIKEYEKLIEKTREELRKAEERMKK